MNDGLAIDTYLHSVRIEYNDSHEPVAMAKPRQLYVIISFHEFNER